MLLDEYLNELFGFNRERDGWDILDRVELPANKKYDYVMNVNNHVCKEEFAKSKINGQICIEKKFLEISIEKLGNLKKLILKCKGSNKCEKVIEEYIGHCQKDIIHHRNNIRLISSGKPKETGSY